MTDAQSETPPFGTTAPGQETDPGAEEAAQFVERVTEMARQNGFPLRCTVESD